MSKFLPNEEMPCFYDERQDDFFKVTSRMKKEYSDKNGTTDGMYTNDSMIGFPAASVDLGWIRDKSNELFDQGKICGKNELHEFVADCVQRCKKIEVNIEGDRRVVNEEIVPAKRYKVDITSKDCSGYYHYRFDLVR